MMLRIVLLTWLITACDQDNPVAPSPHLDGRPVPVCEFSGQTFQLAPDLILICG